ncbi:MAG: CHRD domain-containing protein [Planctomycetota bacterium]
MMKKALLFVLWSVATLPLASAQTLFRADLDGSQEVPPVVTDAGGWGKFTLNPDDTLTYYVTTWGLVATAAHIHIGDEGVSGGILFGLMGGPTIWSGTTPALSAGDKTTLRNRGLYVNVHTSAHPLGEVRGQIEARPVVFGAHLTGDQEVPSTGSPGSGTGTFVVNSDKTITFHVEVSGLQGIPGSAHIHTGGYGSNGGILFDLGVGPPWDGTTPAMTTSNFDALQASGLYINVHTNMFPTGEVRGQIIASEVPYGWGCPGSVGDVALHATGAPTPGGTITISVSGGRPSSTGVLIASLSDGASLASDCPYLLGAPILFLSLPLNAGGAINLPALVPDLPISLDVFFQFVNFDDAAPGNGKFATSNGLLIPFKVF